MSITTRESSGVPLDLGASLSRSFEDVLQGLQVCGSVSGERWRAGGPNGSSVLCNCFTKRSLKDYPSSMTTRNICVSSDIVGIRGCKPRRIRQPAS